MRSVFLFLLIVLTSASLYAQKRVKLKQADNLYGSIRNGERFDRLIGNVIFIQNTTTIYCDSAHFYRSKNEIEAYGHVHITEGDSVDVTSLQLFYDGNKKLAKLRKNVVFVKLATATLYTDFLDYYREKNEARYFNGGKLVDTTNVLTSVKGYYDINTNLASFKTNVVGVNPDYTLNSDTLQYNSHSKVVYFKDFTTVKDKEGGTAYYHTGFYNTNKKLSNLENGEVETPTYKMKGDEYFIDDFKKFYKARKHVVMTSKEENITIFGDEGYYDKLRGISKVYGNAYMAKVGDDKDTLFLSADTLVSIESQIPARKRLLAYHDVKIFKTDMQGTSDSLVYVSKDSTLYMYFDPVLWSDENQMTADSIHMLMKHKKIDKIYMINNSFVVSEDTLQNFNQIKGRKMTANFDGKNISHVIVQGNGESIYAALEEKEIKKDSVTTVKTSITTGTNKLVCSNMRINFKKGKVNNISFYIKPDASFIPPHELKEADKKLKGFAWRSEERPEKKDVVKQNR
jgi:lipopolysaccharide export system protein LptA